MRTEHFHPAVAAVVLSIALLLASPAVQSASSQEIDIKVSESLEAFKEKVNGGGRFLQEAEGVLVFPDVVKAGFGVGGEYGEGALLIGGETVDYYSTAAASIGFQLGAQFKSVVLVFLEKAALESFRNSDGWEAGVDGSVALVELGAGKDVNSVNFDNPIAGFVFSNKGLMYNLTLEGSKITRIDR